MLIPFPVTKKPITIYAVKFTPEMQQLFWSYVIQLDIPDSCWPWAPAVADGSDTARATLTAAQGMKKVKAQRLALSFSLGYPIPNKIRVRNLCENPICVRPSHLHSGEEARNWKPQISAMNIEQILEDYVECRGGYRAIASKYGYNLPAVEKVIRSHPEAILRRRVNQIKKEQEANNAQ